MRRVFLTAPGAIRLQAEVAETRRERMRGLLRSERLPPGRAMLFLDTRSVHTVGMRFPVEVAFLDADMVVLAVKRLRPGRLAISRRGTRHVLECAAGTGLGPGVRLRIRE